MAERRGQRESRLDGGSTTPRAARASDQLRFVADLGALVTSALDPDELLQGFGQLVTERLGTLAVIDLAGDGEGSGRTLVAAHGLRLPAALDQIEHATAGAEPADMDAPTSKHARIVAASHGSDTRDPERTDGGASTPGAPLRSLLTGPITIGGDVIGSITVASHDPRAFTADDMPFWEEVGRRLGLALEAIGARDQHKVMVDLLQRALLPAGMPDVAGFRCAARYEPAMEDTRIGGDWWDAFTVDGELVVTVGDVVGHDLCAAAAMGWLRHAAHAYSVEHADIDVVLERLSAYAARHDATSYATAVLAFAEPTSGVLRYCSAGHPPPLVLRGAEAHFLTDGRNPPLGVHNSRTTVGSIVLEPQDTVILYTDGLYERRGVPLNDRLAELAQRAVSGARLPPQQLCDHIVAGMTETMKTADDIAIVAVRRTPL